jgi:hypothetical protein
VLHNICKIQGEEVEPDILCELVEDGVSLGSTRPSYFFGDDGTTSKCLIQ